MEAGAFNAAAKRRALSSGIVQQDDGGGGLFGGGFKLPNLGGITAFKQLAGGITGLPGLAYSILPGGSKSQLPNLARGLGSSLFSVASTAAKPITGIPGTDWSLADRVIEPLGEKLTGIKPEDLFEQSRREGPIAALVNQVGTAAIVATGGSSAAGALAKSAGAAGDAAKAATWLSRAEKLNKLAHPYVEAGKAGSGLVKAAAESVRPAAQVTSVADDVANVGRVAEAAQPNLFQEAFGMSPDDPNVARQLTALQAPERAAAKALRPNNELRYDIGELTDDVRQRGVQEPLVVQNIDGVDTVVEGNHRLAAAQAAGLDDVPILREAAPDQLAALERQVESKLNPNVNPNEIPENAVRPAAVADEIQGEKTAEIRAAEDAARAEQLRPSIEAQRIGERIAAPAPAWAQRVVKNMPDSVNRVIASAAGPVERWRLHQVRRDYERYVEVAQRVARSSPAVKASQDAARQILEAVPEMHRHDISRIVGEEIAAKLDGTAMVESFIKGGGDPHLEAELRKKARRGYPGVTDEIRSKLSDEQSAALDAAVDTAVDAWRVEARTRLDTLLAGRKGGQGLEQAVLGDTSPVMTPGQAKRYRKAINEMRRARKLKERLPDEISAQRAAAERADLFTQEATEEAARLRAVVGDEIRAMETLREGVPKTLSAARIEQTIDNVLSQIEEGGVTFDPATGSSVLPDNGVVVGIADQFDVPLEEFVANGRELVRDALLNPKDLDGNPYGLGIWNGEDARLGAQQYLGPDGRQRVRGEISIAGNAGKPLEQWQGTILGEAYKQSTIYDSAAGEALDLSEQADIQNLAAHYMDDALDSRSELSRFARQLTKAAEKVPGMTADDVDRALRAMMMWDYSLSRSNPGAYTKGDYFKNASVAFNKATPKGSALLAQTVLRLSTKDAVERALMMDSQTVNKAFQWYYDSHDYIEKQWGDKTLRLLNGEERAAKDVFYDLIAVTSVMASPKQNFGRALMALGNLDKFLASNKSAMRAAEAIMAELQRVPAGVDPSTKLSLRFANIPEVRALTNRTSMVTVPKYNVMDILTGKLKLDDASDADIAKLPEAWTGKEKTLGVGRGVPPIFKKDYDERGGVSPRSRQVEPDEFQAVAAQGKQIVEGRRKRSTPNALDVDTLAAQLYPKVKESWGGDTIDTHTLEPVVKDETGTVDQYAVTAKTRGQESVRLSEGASQEEFRAALAEATEKFKAELDSEGAHLGVFHDDDLGVIDIDPVYVVNSLEESDAIGAYTGALGGAYHYQSGDGFFSPYIANDALMERRGSSMLAKLRSFRDNLANPHESMAVTLDSVMGRLWGYDQTHWGKAGEYEKFANEIREAADMLSARFGRQVKPHEVQALLWVFAKQEIGRQDWGRLQAHYDIAMGQLDDIETRLAAGQEIDPKAFDPFGDWWDEEIGFSREALEGRQRRKELKKRGKLTPDEEAELADLDATDLRNRESEVMVAKQRDNIEDLPDDAGAYGFESRREIPYDAKKLATKETQFYKYRDEYLKPIQEALVAGDVDEARALITKYITKRQRSILGDAEGGAFDTVAEESLVNTVLQNGEENVTRQALANLEGAENVPTPEMLSRYQKRGDVGELHDQFFGTLRGAMLENPGADGRLMMRLFQDAALDTVLHEGGHLLRRILPADKMREVEARYPGIADNTLTGARKAAEEKFVADMMLFMRKKRSGPLSDVFEKIGATLEEQYATLLDTQFGRNLGDDVTDFWDNLFNPDVIAPDAINDPINLQRVSPQGTETKQFRWENDAEFAQRARQYGEQRNKVSVAKSRARHAEKQVRKADGAARRMWAVFNNEPGRIEREINALNNHARSGLERLGAELQDPSTGQVPPEWRPMMEAFNDIRKDVEAHPELADYLDEIPENFAAVLKHAAEHGFTPSHIQDITWSKAQKALFGHVQLGKGALDTAEESGLRKKRTGALHRAGIADRSVESLAAGLVDATHELYSNELVSWIEKYYARPYTPGTDIPEGWTAWDPERNAILTGERANRATVAPNAGQIIPNEVSRALRSMSQPYDHWSFHNITKVTKPWRTLLLTLSPKWYLNNVFGNAVLATAEGVRFQDWKRAWTNIRKGEHQLDVVGHSYINTLEEGEGSLISRGVRSTAKGEGVKAAKDTVKHKLVRLNEFVDELSRTAVYEKTLRLSPGAREKALTRAYRAMVDYGDLSPFERGFVRSVIPFYAWQKGMLKLITRFPSDHPVATGMLLQLGKLHEEMLQDRLGGPVPDAYMGMTNVGGWRNLRALNPFADAIQLATPQGIAQSTNPFVDVFLRDAYNAPEYGASRAGISATGGPEEKVDYAKAVGQQLLGFPQVRLAQNEIGGEDIYGQDAGRVGAITRFLGNPRSFSEEDIDKIAGRGKVAALTQRLNGMYSFDWAARVAEQYLRTHPDATESEIDEYVARTAARRSTG
jgi:hypothetical protein